MAAHSLTDIAYQQLLIFIGGFKSSINQTTNFQIMKILSLTI